MSELQQLEATIQGLESQRALLGDAVVDAALGPLRERRARLLADPAAPPAQARRHVTILFMDVVGSTALAQHLDAEEMAAVMDDLLARATAIVAAQLGKVLQYAGDSLLAAFGAERAAEDDAERAVRCGLELLALGRAVRAEVEAAHGHAGLDVRVGVHSGGVVLGGGVDEDASIRGVAVHVAARLEQAAPPGSLRISHETHALVRGLFDVEAQAPLQAKGLEAPLRSYLVLRARPRDLRGTGRGIEGVETRMVGRNLELRSLQAAFERVLAPGAGLERVLVVGDAGVGKSRLLREFDVWAIARHPHVVAFRARATPQSPSQPHALLRELFAARFRIGDGDDLPDARRKLEAGLLPLFAGDLGREAAEAHVHLLGQLIGLDYAGSPHVVHIRDDARQIRARGFNAAAEALRRSATRAGAPLVVCFDDLHWADDASLDFIDHLAAADRNVPLLLLGLGRPELLERRPPPAGLVRIDLGPLDRASSRELADELLKKVLQAHTALRELLTGGADGNPFYMEELVRMLVDQGALRTGDTWSVDADRLLSVQVPPTLGGVLQARLDSLPPAERRALQLASVIGVRFWDAALAHVDPQAAEQLPALRRRDLVVPDATGDAPGEHVFRHQLLQQAAYDSLLKRDRRDAHARAAQWLAAQATSRAPGLLETAAEHHAKAGDDANATDLYARAAAWHASTFANEQALECAAHALALAAPGDAELRWRVLATRERTLDLLARREAQLQDIEALRALADVLPAGREGDARRAEAAWRRCDIADRTSDWPTAAREGRRALELAERAGAEDIALRAMQRLAQALAFQGDPVAGLAIAERGLARATAFGSPVARSRLANAMSLCAVELGDAAGSLRHDLAMLGFCREAGDRRSEAVALINIGIDYVRFGADADARSYLEASLRLNRELGNKVTEGGSWAALSELALREGDAAAALTSAQAALDILVAAGSPFYEMDGLHNLGSAQLALGRHAEAQATFEREEALARALEVPAKLRNALEAQARVALARDDLAGAVNAVKRLLAEIGEGEAVPSTAALGGTDEHRVRLTLQQVWSRAGDARAGAALAEAHRALQAQANTITDDALRRSFLERIPENREITRLADAAGCP
jgi:class 3 adenylate cyclase